MKNIILIGFMGVGKGRTARALAEITGRYALDCDDLIESYCNLKVKNIFGQFGESRFRQLEKKTAKWLESSVDNAVVSTGGGFFKVPNIRKLGCIVYLHNDFDDIIENITDHPNSAKKIKKRPLLQDMKAARDLYDERLPLYRSIADLVIDVASKDSEAVAKEIAKKMRKCGKRKMKKS
ncbi:MAG: shikimate kinase [Thermodesulfobacteriota bacterium]